MASTRIRKIAQSNDQPVRCSAEHGLVRLGCQPSSMPRVAESLWGLCPKTFYVFGRPSGVDGTERGVAVAARGPSSASPNRDAVCAIAKSGRRSRWISIGTKRTVIQTDARSEAVLSPAPTGTYTLELIQVCIYLSSHTKVSPYILSVS